MSGNAWSVVFILLVAAALVVALTIWQTFRTQQAEAAARAATAQDEAYRALAEAATAAARQSADEQQRIAAELVEIRTRLAAIEKVLNEVG